MRGKVVWLGVVLAAAAFAQERQQARSRIDVQNYAIDAKIDPQAQTLTATAQVTFIPLDDTSTLSFELNNALNLSKVTGEDGREVPASRLQ